MKKDNKKKKRGEARREQSEDMRNLNSELGSYGLAPPKHYGSQQPSGSRSSQNARYSNQKPGAQGRSTTPRRRKDDDARLTPQEKAKRNTQKRRLKKQVRHILSGIAIVIAVAVILVIISILLFKVDTITIKGNKHYSTKQITAVLPIEEQQSMLLTDTDGAEEKLKENLPYIYQAEIKRKLPSTVTVTITETPQVYYIKNADKTYTLLDDNLKVLEEKSGKKPKKGIAIRKAAIESAQQGQTVVLKNEKTAEYIDSLLKTVKTCRMEKVTALYSAGINNNFVEYDHRITIKLGTLDEAEDKLYAAMTAIETLSQTNPEAEGEITAKSVKQVYFTEK